MRKTLSILSVGALLFVVLFAQPQEQIVLRANSPAKVREWTSRHEGKPVALLFRSGAIKQEHCAALTEALDEAGKFGIAGIVVHRQVNWPCPELNARIHDEGSMFRNIQHDAWQMVIIGLDRRVRHIARIDSAAIGRFASIAKDWEAGRNAFSVHCGHCHGDDGADTSYENIKTMASISTRMSHDKILEGGQMFGAVDMSSWTKHDVRSLLLYIDGL